MEVVLLEKINKLGEWGEQVKVKAGYGRNYLIPQGKAIVATPENIKEFELGRESLAKERADVLETTKVRLEKLNAVELTLSRMAGEAGKLFGSVTAADIAKAVTETGVELASNEIRLLDGPLRTLGEFDVAIHLSAEAEATVKVSVIAEES